VRKALAEPEQSLVEKQVGFMAQNFTQMIDKEYRPTEAEMADFTGEPAKGAWIELRRFVEECHDMPPGIVFGGARYDWGVRQLTGEQWKRAEVCLSERRRR
jgi:hypothetical protein